MTGPAEEWYYCETNDHMIRWVLRELAGYECWYVHGKKHRIDGPAEQWPATGRKCWYMHDKRHRVDGPAVEHRNGDKEWYIDDKLHRVDGPAVEKANGDKGWYVDGQLHRTDGPAKELQDRNEWYYRGVLHRSGAPAIEYADGHREWYVAGKLHRDNGPAYEHPCGIGEYYLEGRKYGRCDIPLFGAMVSIGVCVVSILLLVFVRGFQCTTRTEKMTPYCHELEMYTGVVCFISFVDMALIVVSYHVYEAYLWFLRWRYARRTRIGRVHEHAA